MAAQASNTSRAYASDWAQFQAWAERYELQTLTAAPAVIVLYLTSLARRGLKVSTIPWARRSDHPAHRQAGHLPPTSDPWLLTIREGIV